MQISYNWLNDLLDIDASPEELAEQLTLAGLEVDSMTRTGTDFDGVVAGKVTGVRPHPNADKLTLCDVNTGGSEDKTIVCGAPNVREGQKVAVATVGTVLPVENEQGERLTVRKSKIRGEHSEGMICAEDELGLGEDHTGILELHPDVEPGTPFSRLYEPTLDHVLEIELTPNRPDAACHLGVARDLSVLLNRPLNNPLTDPQARTAGEIDGLTVEIKNPEKCARYVAMMVDDIQVGESPLWLKQRLQAIGLRPINNIVDATNFVLHETGQPLHAFDRRLIQGNGIVVQSYNSLQSFTTLDGEERKVPAGGLFICDKERPVALAGIMGGQNTEIQAGTTSVLIESAWFEPVGVRSTARRLGLQTDSSYRFERGVDPQITARAAWRCARLITDIAGGRVGDRYIDEHPAPHEPRQLPLDTGRMNRYLGTGFSVEQATATLKGLGFRVEEDESGAETGSAGEAAGPILTCTVPSFRPDVDHEVDLYEEVARIHDYNRIPRPDHLKSRDLTPIPFRETFVEKVRDTARGMGLKEIYSNSLLPEYIAEQIGGGKERTVATLNPITSDQAVLRPSLLYGILRSADYNFKRDAAQGVRFFEIGNIFQNAGKGGGRYFDPVWEETRILLGMSGLKSIEHWYTKKQSFSAFDLKQVVEGFLTGLGLAGRYHTEQREADVLDYLIDGQQVGTLYQVDEELLRLADLNTNTFAAELSVDQLQALAPDPSEQRMQPIPRYPVFEFDLALVVDKSVRASQLERTIRHTAGNRLHAISVFDVFEGGSLPEGQKSIAFRMKFLDVTKTLTINDVNPIIQKILKKLDAEHGAKLRS